jgi:hypothetical protein
VTFRSFTSVASGLDFYRDQAFLRPQLSLL